MWAVPASPQTALVYLSVLQVRVLALCKSSSISVFGMDSIFSHFYFLIHHSLRNRLMGFAWNVKCQNTEPSTNSIYKAWYKCSSRSDRSICQEHCELRTAYRKGKRCINRLRNNWCSVGTSRLTLHDPEISIPISLPLFPNSTLSGNLWQRKGTQKHSSVFLVTTETPSPVVASSQSLRLSILAFDQICAQTQLLVDTSPPLAYRLYNLLALVRVCGFSDLDLGLENWLRSCFAQMSPLFILFQFGRIWLTPPVEKPITQVQKTY